MTLIRFGVLTVSDTASSGTKDDISGQKVEQAIRDSFPTSQIVMSNIVPDEKERIESCLKLWCVQCDVIVTTGGTGFSQRDVTPEATKAVIDKEAPGLAYAMLTKSLAITEMAMLSRAVCGIRSKTLIINLPGSPKGAVECFNFVKNSIPHAVALLTDNKELIEESHKSLTATAINEKSEISSDKSAKLKSGHVSCSPSKVVISIASRPRESVYPMLDVQAALDKIFLELSPTVLKQTIPVTESLNRILADDVFAPHDIPAYRTSIKDGYAVMCADGDKNRRIRNVIAAGDSPFENALQPGEAIRINTGAVVPPGADAVIQVENTNLLETTNDGQESLIQVKSIAKEGQDIREIGSDVAKNDLVLKKYDRIQPAHMGVLVSLGLSTVKIFAPARIGILSTGNEVKEPHEKLQPGQIYDSNKVSLINMLKCYGYEATDFGIARDCANELKAALQAALERCDMVITSGGVSMGEYDILKQVLIQDFNATIHFGRVDMKPGKPTTFATLNYKNSVKVIFGLPGNPASANVTCLLFVIPTLRYLERSQVNSFPRMQVYLEDKMRNDDVRPEYVRATYYLKDSYFFARSTGKQISSRLNSMVNANCLLILPGKSSFKDGKQITALITDVFQQQ